MRQNLGLFAFVLCAHALLKELPRERVDTLSLADFQRKYVDKMMPVVLEFPNASLHWRATTDWDQAYFEKKCPAGKIFPVQYYTGSRFWGGFDHQENDTVSFQELFELWRASANSSYAPAYGFDFNIKCHCPDLFDDFEVLKYFLSDEVIMSPVGQSATFPSLMMGPVGSRSGIHTDRYFLPFWLTLLQGRKRWRVITHSDWNTHLQSFFGNQLNGDMVRAFDVFDDTFLKKTPVFKKVTVWTADLLPGDTVYVTTAGAHAGLNLDSLGSKPATAITANFLDSIHKSQVSDTFCDLNLTTSIANDDSCVCPIATGTVEGAKTRKVNEMPSAKQYVSHFISQEFCDLHSRGRFGWTCPLLATKCDDAGFPKRVAKPCPNYISEDRRGVFLQFDKNVDGLISLPEYQMEMSRRIIDHKFTMGILRVNKSVFHDTRYAISVYQSQFREKDVDGDMQVSCYEFFAGEPKPTIEADGSKSRRRKRRRRKTASSEL